MTDTDITYEIVTTRSTSRITVPRTWKVTFGAVVPGKGSTSTAWGLRFWESADKQRMVIGDVVSFRDISIPVSVKACRLFGSDDWFAEDAYWEKSDKVEHDWKNADELTKAPPYPDEISSSSSISMRRKGGYVSLPAMAEIEEEAKW